MSFHIHVGGAPSGAPLLKGSLSTKESGSPNSLSPRSFLDSRLSGRTSRPMQDAFWLQHSRRLGTARSDPRCHVLVSPSSSWFFVSIEQDVGRFSSFFVFLRPDLIGLTSHWLRLSKSISSDGFRTIAGTPRCHFMLRCL